MLFTIGYERRSVDGLVADLHSRHVTRVLDVRELPLSRRRGFSKAALGDALTRAGIEYVHLRDAGNPYRKLKHNIEACLAAYAAHLEDAPEIVELVFAAAQGARTALLCVEHDAQLCHRSVLIRELQRALDLQVVDL